MKWYILMAVVIVIAMPAAIAFGRLYPVAIVNGSPIWYRMWDRYVQGTGHALTVQARAAGTQFNLDPVVASMIKRDTLNALIEDNILTQQARALVPQFDNMSEQKIHDALRSSANIGKASQLMYGFSIADFQHFILLPQSRWEVAQNELGKQKINFAAWLSGAKKKARVHILLSGYGWDGDSVTNLP